MSSMEMRSYLDLVPLSAKVRRRQNRMTILCIVIAVFLVTAVFSMADMMLRTQSGRMSEKHGTWHLELSGLSPEDAAALARRQDVVTAGMMMQFNPDGDADYRLNGRRVTLYGMAAVLFVLVLLAGVLMISGSLNSNVAQRMQFFGMMRCIGMSRAQVLRFVLLEALSWCRTAIPAGLVLGTLVSWGICAVLRFGIGGEFSTTPVFRISAAGLLSGAAVGLVTVLLAAQVPARRAAKASPVAAVSGNGGAAVSGRPIKWKLRGLAEIALGVHHAVSGKKNWALMTASFAMSIVLALCFSVLLEFAGLLLPSLLPWQPDILFNGYGNAQVLPRSMAAQLREIPGVRVVWGAAGLTDFPARSQDADISHVVLCSYDDFMMQSSRGSIVDGTLPETDGEDGGVMTIYNRNNPLKVGNTVTINGVELTITCAFSEGMFPDDVTILCPEATFDRLAGVQDYNMMGVLLDGTADEQTVAQIAGLGTDEMLVTDRRAENRSDRATYLAARVVVYSFCAILALITVFHIVNSISMSVTARIRQYGAMRAVGMDDRQLFWMIAAESLTYAISGLAVGCAAGLPLSRMLWMRLITPYFGATWHLPLGMLCLAAAFVLAAAAAAVYAPARRICTMNITETLSEL